MSEWKLFGDVPPEQPADLAARGWMDLERQPGFTERAWMVVRLAWMVAALRPVNSITDLGCGDGSLLARLGTAIPAWGYDLGAGDVEYGRLRGLDVRKGDITAGGLEYGDLLIASEVAEHLADPVGFLKSLPGQQRFQAIVAVRP